MDNFDVKLSENKQEFGINMEYFNSVYTEITIALNNWIEKNKEWLGRAAIRMNLSEGVEDVKTLILDNIKT